MNEDYLWDKNGEDREIERIESVLSALRYQKDFSPVLPGPIAIVGRERAGRWTFSFGFAFAACLLMVAVGGYWFVVTERNALPAIESVSIKPPSTDVEIPNANTSISTSDIHSQTHDAIEITPRHVRTIFRSRIPRKQRWTLSTARVHTQNKQLTKEEHYAYQQLMLALSITGSKLKIVRDTMTAAED